MRLDTNDQKIRTVLFGFDNSYGHDFADEFERTCNLQIVKWITVHPYIDELHTPTTINALNYTFTNENSFTYLYDSIYPNLWRFIDMYSRNFQANSHPPHHFLEAFNIYCRSAFNDLTTDIELAVFANIPHEGADYIYYLMAKEKGIETIIFCQSSFENRFFYSLTIEDFGLFTKSKPIFDNRSYVIERTHYAEHWYMKEGEGGNTGYFQWLLNKTIEFVKLVKSGQLKDGYSVIREILTKIANQISWRSRNIKMYFEQFKLWVTKNREYGVIGILKRLANRILVIGILRRLANRTYSLPKLKDYDYAIQSFSINRNKLKKYMALPYVYFPLHLQPELTTSAIGDIYSDQMLAIERLSCVLPKNWTILVKENPKQTYWQRGELFFKRLKAIPNVVLVPNETNTFELTANCRLVATITGTAGWEAIKGGKPALVFGRPWYLTLPGVFRYSPDMDITDIANYQIDHDELQQSLNSLLMKTGYGVVDPLYSVIVQNYDVNDNIKNMSNSLKKILDEVIR